MGCRRASAPFSNLRLTSVLCFKHNSFFVLPPIAFLISFQRHRKHSLKMRNGYGTTGSSIPQSNGRAGDEHQPLLRKPEPRSAVARFRKTMGAEVSRSWADVVLLLCYVVTGLLDSASTQVWGAFVSMQTGKPSSASMSHLHGSTLS